MDVVWIARFIFFIRMGGCVSEKANNHKNIERTKSTLEEQPIGLGYELAESPQKEPHTPQKKRAMSVETGVTSSVDSAQKTKSVISLSEALMKSNLDLGDEGQQENLQSWIDEHNTTSSIIKLPKSNRKSKGRQESEVKRSRSLVETFEKCQNIDGQLKADARMQKIVITNLEIDVEFMLSKCRAGPLVVPYITYDQYCTD